MQNSQQYYERHYQKILEVLSDIGGIANLILIIVQSINYLIARYNMLIDTQELIMSIIKKNISIYENLIKTHNPKKIIKPNIQKKNEDNSAFKIFNSVNNFKKIISTDNSENEKEDYKKDISSKINVIKNNYIGEKINRNNKNEESIGRQIGKVKIEENLGNLKRISTRNYIRRNFALINEKESFNCFSYFFYIFFCKRINSNIKYCEELRRLIISEESMIQNYLNIYKLLELQKNT